MNCFKILAVSLLTTLSYSAALAAPSTYESNPTLPRDKMEALSYMYCEQQEQILIRQRGLSDQLTSCGSGGMWEPFPFLIRDDAKEYAREVMPEQIWNWCKKKRKPCRFEHTK